MTQQNAPWPGRMRQAARWGPGARPRGHREEVTKMAQFLDLATERRGSLASIPFNAVAGFNADLALLTDPHPGTDFAHAFSLHLPWSRFGIAAHSGTSY